MRTFVGVIFGVGLLAGNVQAASLDVAVIGHQYPADGVKLTQDMERLKAFQASLIPYSEITAKTTWTAVPGTFDLGCTRPAGYNGRLITCGVGTTSLAVKNAGVVADRILVLVNSGTYGGSGGQIAVAYNGYWMNEVAFHELSHSFGLHDEYVLYSGGTLTNVTYANCHAGTGNPGFAYGGCKYSAWRRSSGTSLMRAIDQRYFNGVSQAWLRSRLLPYVN